MSSTSIVRAIDIGYGNTKFVIDDRGTCRLFPSLAPCAEFRRPEPTVYQRRRTTPVWVDGHEYEVGPDASLFSSIPVLHNDYINTVQFRALLYGALDAMQVPRIDLLVVGLPVHLHETHSARLEDLLVGVHEIRPGVKVEVASALIPMQPLGGFIAHIDDRKQWASLPQKIYLLVDPGFFTLDWMVSRAMHEVPGRSGSIECGVSMYVRSVEEELNRRLLTTHCNIRRIDEGIRNGDFRLNGRKIDLKDFCGPAEQKVMEALCALRNRIGTVHDIDEIVVVGGGGSYFAEGLRRTFPNHAIHTVEDPVFANVRGFQEIGKIFYKSRVK